MDYTKHYYMGAIRVASELGGTPCFDPVLQGVVGTGEGGLPGIPSGPYTEDPCSDVSAVSAEWELADVLIELSIIESGDENQEGWADLMASRNVELNMSEMEFTMLMEQGCPAEYVPGLPSGWETPREGSVLTIGQERCTCELSAYWAELLYGIECDDYRLLYWYHLDYLGHVELVTDPLGNPYQYFFYGAFGDVLAEQNTPWGSFQSAYQFNSKETDTETSYGYYGARYYAPEWSVWLSVDPLAGEYPSMSPFNFSANNPILFVDPDGRTIDPTSEEAAQLVLESGERMLGDRSPLYYDKDARQIKYNEFDKSNYSPEELEYLNRMVDIIDDTRSTRVTVVDNEEDIILFGNNYGSLRDMERQGWTVPVEDMNKGELLYNEVFVSRNPSVLENINGRQSERTLDSWFPSYVTLHELDHSFLYFKDGVGISNHAHADRVEHIDRKNRKMFRNDFGLPIKGDYFRHERN